MPDGSMPRSVVAFLRAHVDHVVKLRFILALHRAPCGVLSVSNAAHQLHVPKGQIREMARELASDELVRYTFDQLELIASVEDRLAIADLAKWYESARERIFHVLAELGRMRRSVGS